MFCLQPALRTSWRLSSRSSRRSTSPAEPPPTPSRRRPVTPRTRPPSPAPRRLRTRGGTSSPPSPAPPPRRTPPSPSSSPGRVPRRWACSSPCRTSPRSRRCATRRRISSGTTYSTSASTDRRTSWTPPSSRNPLCSSRVSPRWRSSESTPPPSWSRAPRAPVCR